MASDFRATPLAPAPNLSATLASQLRAEIESKRLDVGSRFPTDAELARAFGVSRTVVREAVSVLRAEGLVATRRGRGSVVAARLPARAFGITQEEVNSLNDVLRVLELRTGLESEAAGLAALRRTAEDIRSLGDCLSRMDRAIARGEDAVEADIDFHLVIAAATQNDYFPRLLGSFKTVFIARRRVRSDLSTPPALKAYLDAIQAQHRRIFEAIEAGDADAASHAMREHLKGGRYRVLREQATEAGGPQARPAGGAGQAVRPPPPPREM